MFILPLPTGISTPPVKTVRVFPLGRVSRRKRERYLLLTKLSLPRIHLNGDVYLSILDLNLILVEIIYTNN